MGLGSGENSLVLDVATCDGGSSTLGQRPSLITHNLTDAEKNREIVDAGSGYRAKAEREKTFSLEIMALALDVRVQSGQTLRAQDKQLILNSITQRDLDEPAVVKHEAYDRYNQRLRALFALGFWRRVMMGSGEQSEIQQLQLKMCRALQADQWRKSLTIDMAFMTGSDLDQKIQLAVNSLPPHLKELKLDLRGTDTANETIIAIANALPRGLEAMVLDLGHNPKIDNSGVESMVNRLPPTLTHCHLGLQGCGTAKELTEKGSDLGDVKQYMAAEAAKGVTCNTLNLCPSPTRRMETFAAKFKLDPTVGNKQ